MPEASVQRGRHRREEAQESARTTVKDYSAFLYELVEPEKMELFWQGFDQVPQKVWWTRSPLEAGSSRSECSGCSLKGVDQTAFRRSNGP